MRRLLSILALVSLPAFAETGRHVGEPVVSPQARPGVVAGAVRNADGTPAAHIRVTAMEKPVPGAVDRALAIMSFSESDENGRYRLEDIPSGLYYIVAGRLDLPTYYPGTTDRAAARDVPVAAGAVIADVDFIVESASLQLPKSTSTPIPATAPKRVSGRFVVEGRPLNATTLTSVKVRAERPSDGWMVTVESGTDGTFAFQLTDGDYRIAVAPPRGHLVKSIFFQSADLMTQLLKVDGSIFPLGPGTNPNSNARRMQPLQFGRRQTAASGPEIVVTLAPQSLALSR